MPKVTGFIPAHEPIPLPAPVWLLQAFLFVTFLLHLVPMNLTVGGLLFLARGELSGRLSEPMRRWVVGYLPITTAYTITTGIAPLLFLQVVYGQLFFPAAILMAWAWFLVIVALIAGYYGIYAYAWASERLGRWRVWVIVGSTALFLYIAFAFNNAITLMSAPFRWWILWQERNPSTHFNLNLFEPTLFPRFAHFVLGAMAFFGLVTALYAATTVRRRDEAASREMFRTGVTWFVGATMLNYLVGLLFLFTHEPSVWRLFVGGNMEATILLWGSVALSLVGVVASLLSLRTVNPSPTLLVAFAALSVTIVGMAMVRFWVRSQLLSLHAPEFRLSELPVQPQWGIVIFFVFLLLVGFFVVTWMVLQLQRAYALQSKQGS